MIETVGLSEPTREVAFAHLLASGEPVSICTPTVLLCSEVHGREWGRRRADHGRLLVLATAAEECRQRWAGCARAARRLGHAE